MPISFHDFQLHGNEPVYQQVIRYFKQCMLLGRLQQGEEVPSRRALAATLGINPTTVQKIYKQLEGEGLVTTQPNSKTTVSLSPGALEAIRRELTEGQARLLLKELKNSGLDFKQVIDLIGRLWDEV